MNWDEIEIQLNKCGRDVWPIGLRHSKDWFTSRLVDFDFWFVWQGVGFLRDHSGRVLPLRRGVCLFMRPKGEYEAWQAEGSRLGVSYFHFRISPLRISKKLLNRSLPDSFLETTRSELFASLTSRIVSLQQEIVHLNRPHEPIHALQRQILKTILQEYELESRYEKSNETSGVEKHHQQVVSEAIKLFTDNYRDIRKIDALASSLGYGRDHFHKIFKRVTGTTPHRVLTNIRMDRAKDLLRNSDLSIGSLAYEVGYDSVFHFSRQFKEFFGCPPSDFRKSPV